MPKKVDWIIHGVCDGHRVNFHTHGMERYNHMDFQMVLPYPHQELCRIINTMGLRVQAGERFKDGDLVAGIYEDCNVQLMVYEETRRNVLRIIVPDKNNRFPYEQGCEYPYNLQLLPTDFLVPVEKYRPLN